VPDRTDLSTQRRVLVIEDEVLIAESPETILVEAGFQVAGVAGKVERALELVDTVACDAAILDANLIGVSASSVARALSDRGLPFIVLSGYTREQLPSDFSGGAFVQKPFRIDQLLGNLKSMFSSLKAPRFGGSTK
jgi:DNA-binding response OmpR family regulator